MTDVMPEQQAVDLDELVGDGPAGTDSLDAVDEQLIARLVGRARDGGLQLAGEGGLLAQLTKRLVESALEGEITDHLGYDRHDAAGRDGGNSRNGHRAKTVLTEVGPVEIDVPRDRDATFASASARRSESDWLDSWEARDPSEMPTRHPARLRPGPRTLIMSLGHGGGHALDGSAGAVGRGRRTFRPETGLSHSSARWW